MIKEIIHFINKPDQHYWCQELHREPGYLVLRYDVKKDAHIGSVLIPAQSLTIAHYWQGFGRVLWELYGPDRQLIGYCYHLCLPVEIGDSHVEYQDLLLDLWFDPQGNLTVLDQDELDRASAEGKVSKDVRKAIECERDTIAASHTQIIADLWRPPGGVGAL